VNESTSARLRDRTRDGADIEAIQIHSARGKDRSLEYHNAVSALFWTAPRGSSGLFGFLRICFVFFSLFSGFLHAERTKGAKGSVHVRR
jgi:hypothetical protein